MLSISKKTRAGRVTIISYIALAIFILGFIVSGLLSITILSDSGSEFVTSLVAILTFASLFEGIFFYLILACFLFLAIVSIIKACKYKKKNIVIRVFEACLLCLVFLFVMADIVAYRKEVAEYVTTSFVEASSSSAALISVVGFIISILALITYTICVLFVLLEVDTYAKKDDSEYVEGDPNTLTEDDMRRVIREELESYYASCPAPAVEEKKEEEPAEEEQKEEEPAEENEPVEETVEEEPAEEVKEEEPVVEEPEEQVEEPAEEEVVVENEPEVMSDEKAEVLKQVEALHLNADDLNGTGRISFVEKLLTCEDDLLEIYNTLKNKLLSFGLNSRLSASGDTFRLHRETYAKITISGKKVKIYLALDPKDFQDSTIPFVDVGHKKSFESIPFAFKVKSGLSIRRALELIEVTMEKAGIVQVNEPEDYDYARDLVNALKAIRDGQAE